MVGEALLATGRHHLSGRSCIVILSRRTMIAVTLSHASREGPYGGGRRDKRVCE